MFGGAPTAPKKDARRSMRRAPLSPTRLPTVLLLRFVCSRLAPDVVAELRLCHPDKVREGVKPAAEGIVRLTGRELADRRWSRLSRCKLTPSRECGSAVLLEDIAAVEVTVLVEVIVDRSMGGGKLLEGFHVPELRHRSFSSTERLV